MSVEEKEDKQLRILAGSGRNVSKPKKYMVISRSPTTEDRSALYTPLKEYGGFNSHFFIRSEAKLEIPGGRGWEVETKEPSTQCDIKQKCFLVEMI